MFAVCFYFCSIFSSPTSALLCSLFCVFLSLETLPWWLRSCCDKTPVFLSPSMDFAFLLPWITADCILLSSASVIISSFSWLSCCTSGFHCVGIEELEIPNNGVVLRRAHNILSCGGGNSRECNLGDFLSCFETRAFKVSRGADWCLHGIFFVPLGYRTVDALLQRMFEAEIPLEDEGPSFEEILNLSPTSAVPRSPSSESAA